MFKLSEIIEYILKKQRKIVIDDEKNNPQHSKMVGVTAAPCPYAWPYFLEGLVCTALGA